MSPRVLKSVTGWIARHRRRAGARPNRRAGTVHTQVALVLRWLRHRLDLRVLALQAQVSIATAYRYLHEALELIAAHSPTLPDVLADARDRGLAFLCLDGTLVATDRVADWVPGEDGKRGHHLWFSGKHRRFGGNVQVLTEPGGFPLWVSDVRPGSIHDLVAAREQVLPAVYPYAARDLPVLSDKGYTGAGVGIHTPIKKQPGGRLHTDNQSYNALVTALRAPTERGNALLGHWRALDRVTVCPQRIGVIVAAALVLISLDRGSR